MAKTTITCPVCGRPSDKETGAVNRARKNGNPIYCGRACSGKARRKGKSREQKRAEKAEYDREYRAKNRAMLKAKKATYHKRTYDPAKAAEARKKRMPWHAEYCRRPEYRKWKKQYDRKYRAKKDYGEFWECHVLALEVREAALAQQSDYEIRLSKGRVALTTQRKRDYDRLNREEPEIGALGNAEQGKRGKHGAGVR